MSATEEYLKEISHKLDQLIILFKMSNRSVLDDFKKELQRDKIALKIIQYADGSLSYSEISKKVAEDIDAAEITIKKKIAELRDKGVLVARRKGRAVYYQNSGLLD